VDLNLLSGPVGPEGNHNMPTSAWNEFQQVTYSDQLLGHAKEDTFMEVSDGKSMRGTNRLASVVQSKSSYIMYILLEDELHPSCR
jgi:hypothetical protein